MKFTLLRNLSESFLTELPFFRKELKKIQKIYDIDKLFVVFKQLYCDLFSLKAINIEENVNNRLIYPLLQKLGYYFLTQQRLTAEYQLDILLFKDKTSLEQYDRLGKTEDDKKWKYPITFLEAKHWNIDLDKKSEKYRTPSKQIRSYLAAFYDKTKGKRRWGILTNGHIWRIYKAFDQGVFEIDLSEIFLCNGLESFKHESEIRRLFEIFIVFFNPLAFSETEWRKDKSFFELVIDERRNYEIKLTDNLKEKIFVDVFPTLATGFMENLKKNGIKINEDTLRQVYDNTLILLYRFLFLLYADDRSLLPKNLYPLPSFNHNNETAIKRLRLIVANIVDNQLELSKNTDGYWHFFRNIFKIIYSGEVSLKLPAYNGGLFNSEKHDFLERFGISDFYLIPAFDRLSRDYSFTQPKFINYSDLDVRHLGSIYEGLLEFKLKVAETDLTLAKTKESIDVYKPVKSKKEKIVVKAGSLYLTNDKGERKASGSYYTPQDIVEHLVVSTLHPIIQTYINDFENHLQQLKSKKSSVRDKNIELSHYDPAAKLLDLKIVDPAMGSGHFLVYVIDFLTEQIESILDEYSSRTYFGKQLYESPVEQQIKNIIETYGLPDDLNTRSTILRRLILKRCIYGVDLNPLAVELAKLSLWLHTLTVNLPLSFLDHHLKIGNSLIGTSKEDFENQTTKLFGSVFGKVKNIVATYRQISEKLDLSIEEINDERSSYQAAEAIIKELKLFYDLYTVQTIYPTKFKNLNKLFLPAQETEITDLLKRIANLKFDDATNQEIKQALELAKKLRVFHWELEFPEVWQVSHKPGFTVVISNPPWVSLKGKHGHHLESEVFDYFVKTYNLNTYRPNLYEAFIVKDLSLLAPNAYLGLVLPDRLAYNVYSKDLRKKLLEDYRIVSVEVGWEFSGIIADVLTIIVKNENTQNYQFIVNFLKSSENLILEKNNIDKTTFKFTSQQTIPNTVPLSAIAFVSTGFIAKKGAITKNKQTTTQIEIAKGETIKPFYFDRQNLFYIDFKKENLAGGTQDTAKLSVKPKILLRKTGDRVIAAYDETGIYPEQSLYFLYNIKPEYNPLYLLGILNSNVIQYIYRKQFITNPTSVPQLKKVHLDQFPIPKADKEKQDEIVRIVEKLMKIKAELAALPDLIVDAENKKEYSKVRQYKAEVDKLQQEYRVLFEELNRKIYELYGLPEA